jgi:preprotein translocase subunit SecG
MSTFFWIGIVAHILICLFLMLLVLVQNDKSSSGLGALSGMASNTLGAAGAATFIQKLTRAVAIVFMAIVFLLSLSVSKADIKAPTSQLKAKATGLGAVLPDDASQFQVEMPTGAAPTQAPAATPAPAQSE